MAAPTLRPRAAVTHITGVREWVCDAHKAPVVAQRIRSAKLFKGEVTLGPVFKVAGGMGRAYLQQVVRFEGVVAVQVGGYRLAASIDYTAPKPVIDYHVDGAKITVPQAPRCDHCSTNRNRHRTYVGRDAKGNELHLGGDCAALYWGKDLLDEVGLLAGVDQMLGLSESEWGERFNVNAGMYFDLQTAANLILDDIQRFGFVSRAAAFDSRTAASSHVASQVLRYYTTFGETDAVPEHLKKQFPDVERIKLLDASAALMWADEQAVLNAPSSLWLNYAAARENDFVSLKQAGLLAYVLGAWVEASRPRAGVFVGEVGKRITTPIELQLTQRMVTDWGFVSVFEDSDGNVYKAFGKIPHTEVGERKACTFFVKDHSIFREQKQTVINRIK